MLTVFVLVAYYAINAYIKVDNDWKTKYEAWHKDSIFFVSIIGAIIADFIIFFSSNAH